MICHQVSFENTNDKHIDYNLLLETPYYYQPSPTPSTPLSSPAYSLIQDEVPMYSQQQEHQIPPSLVTMACHQEYTSSNDDWLLDPFYDLNSLSYSPLVVSSVENAPMFNTTRSTPSSIDPVISMMMAEVSAEAPSTTVNDPVSPSLSSHVMAGMVEQAQPSPSYLHTSDNIHQVSSPATDLKKKSCKRKVVPYANQMRSLNFNYNPASSVSSTYRQASSSLSSTPPLDLLTPRQKKTKSTPSPSPYMCDFPGCEKSFTRPYNLKSHRRTHTNEKPFECAHCPKTFARQHDRNRHAKLHLGVKPFLCFLCFKSFARQDALSRHQRWSEEGVIGCSTLKRKKTISARTQE